MLNVIGTCKAILTQGFAASGAEEVDFCRKFEEDIRQHSKDMTKKLFQDINTNLLRKFNKAFKEDGGKIRDWLRHEEA